MKSERWFIWFDWCSSLASYWHFNPFENQITKNIWKDGLNLFSTQHVMVVFSEEFCFCKFHGKWWENFPIVCELLSGILICLESNHWTMFLICFVGVYLMFGSWIYRFAKEKEKRNKVGKNWLFRLPSLWTQCC